MAFRYDWGLEPGVGFRRGWCRQAERAVVTLVDEVRDHVTGDGPFRATSPGFGRSELSMPAALAARNGVAHDCASWTSVVGVDAAEADAEAAVLHPPVGARSGSGRRRGGAKVRRRPVASTKGVGGETGALLRGRRPSTAVMWSPVGWWGAD